MAKFDRMLSSFFQPKAPPTRYNPWEAEKRSRLDKIQPTIDEDTARLAREIIENHAVERVFDRLRGAALAEITGSKPGSEGVDVREKGYLKIIALDELHAEIQAMADELKLHRPQE